jgi:hypothetical protein
MFRVPETELRHAIPVEFADTFRPHRWFSAARGRGTA